jgi:hypothetical protein
MDKCQQERHNHFMGLLAENRYQLFKLGTVPAIMLDSDNTNFASLFQQSKNHEKQNLLQEDGG